MMSMLIFFILNNTSLKSQLEYSERWRLALEKALTKQIHKMRILLEDNPHLNPAKVSKPKIKSKSYSVDLTLK